MGRAISGTGRSVPARPFMLLTKKPAYLKTPKSSTLNMTEKTRRGFLKEVSAIPLPKR